MGRWGYAPDQGSPAGRRGVFISGLHGVIRPDPGKGFVPRQRIPARPENDKGPQIALRAFQPSGRRL